MLNIIFAAGCTFVLYIVIQLIRLTKGFFIYKKTKEIILMTIYGYLFKIDLNYLNLDILRQIIEKELAEVELFDKIDFIKLKWSGRYKFIIEFKLNLKKNYPIHKFSFNINKIKKGFEEQNIKGGVSYES